MRPDPTHTEMTNRSSDHLPAALSLPACGALNLLHLRSRTRVHGGIRAILLRGRSFLPLIGLLGLVGPRSAQAMGFTGTFSPTSWVLVNTYTAPDGPDQQLTSPDFMCRNPSGVPGNNDVSCIQSYVVGNAGTPGNALLTLIGSMEGDLGGGTDGLKTVTTLTMKNDPSLATRYRITFHWSFAGPAGPGISLTGGCNSPPSPRHWERFQRD